MLLVPLICKRKIELYLFLSIYFSDILDSVRTLYSLKHQVGSYLLNWQH